MMHIDLSELSLVVLVGEDDNRKMTFINKHFDQTEVVHLESIEDSINKRLEEAQFTVMNVIDLQKEHYEKIVRLAKKYHYTPIAIVFNTGQSIDKPSPIKELATILEKKGFKKIYILNDQDGMDTIKVNRTKLANNKRDSHGPFDIIGDIHGCYDELCQLLEKLGYKVDEDKAIAYPAKNRKVIFLGDLVDRGPKSPKVLRLVMSMVKDGGAYCVRGNHDGKLQRKLQGSKVQVIHGLEKTLEQLEHESVEFIEEVKQFLEGLVSHYVLDEGRLVVAHAGLKEDLQGRESRKVKDFAMFGETTGQVDEFGLPIRLNWSDTYKGSAFVVYGHTPQEEARIINNTINIDTGCVYGGKLTAFRYPEKEIVDVKAKALYYESVRPLFK